MECKHVLGQQPEITIMVQEGTALRNIQAGIIRRDTEKHRSRVEQSDASCLEGDAGQLPPCCNDGSTPGVAQPGAARGEQVPPKRIDDGQDTLRGMGVKHKKDVSW